MKPMKSVIYRQIPRPDPALLARAAEFGVADLHGALGLVAGRMSLMSPDMNPIALGQRLCGPAITAWNFPGDNLAIHCALDTAQAGDVLVFTNGGGHQGALWGDVACGFAVKKGVAGAVVHGACREAWASPSGRPTSRSSSPRSVGQPRSTCRSSRTAYWSSRATSSPQMPMGSW